MGTTPLSFFLVNIIPSKCVHSQSIPSFNSWGAKRTENPWLVRMGAERTENPWLARIIYLLLSSIQIMRASI
jgi:hypothetical protein